MKLFNNKLFLDLYNNRIVKKKDFFFFTNEIRDSKKINVYKNNKLKFFILDNCLTGDKYYRRKKNDKTEIVSIIKINNKKKFFRNATNSKLKLSILSKIINKKTKLCDFGCGIGDFFSIVKKYTSKIYGVEISKDRLKILKKKYKNIFFDTKIENFKTKFDVISLIHVLSHLVEQVSNLKRIYNSLNKNGYIFIEAIHSNDLLLKLNIPEYRKFKFSKEFLIIHSKKSLELVLRKSGFKNIKIYYDQRFNYLNMINWVTNRAPGGHDILKKYFNKSLNEKFKNSIEKTKQADTLLAVAQK